MVWIIEKVVKSGELYVTAGGVDSPVVYFMKPNSSFKIGRKQVSPPCIVTGGPDLGEEDKTIKESVSRQHAEVSYVQQTGDKGEKREVVTLTDTGSKFGTHVKSASEKGFTRLEANVGRQIADQDVVRFGAAAVFRFKRVRFAFCCTRLAGDNGQENVAEKQKIQEMCARLGLGRLVAEVDEASHLVTKDLSSTHKVLTAVALGKPVVTPSWLYSFADKNDPYTLIPSTQSFLPPPLGSTPDFSFDRVGEPRRKLLSAFVVVLIDPLDSCHDKLLRACGAATCTAPAASAGLSALEAFFRDELPSGKSVCLLEDDGKSGNKRGAEAWEAYTARLQQCKPLAGNQFGGFLSIAAVCKAVMRMEAPSLVQNVTHAHRSAASKLPHASIQHTQSSQRPVAHEAQGQSAAERRVLESPAAAARGADKALVRQETVLPSPLPRAGLVAAATEEKTEAQIDARRHARSPTDDVTKAPRPAPPAISGGKTTRGREPVSEDAEEVREESLRAKKGKRSAASARVAEDEMDHEQEQGQQEEPAAEAEQEQGEEEEAEEEEEEQILTSVDIDGGDGGIGEDEDGDGDGWETAPRGAKRRLILHEKRERLPLGENGKVDLPEAKFITVLMKQSALNAKARAGAPAAAVSAKGSSSYSRRAAASGPDFRKFRKNSVMVASPSARVTLRDMTVIHPKETERHMAFKEAEKEKARQEAFKEELFLDRYEKSTKGRGR